jgi:CheY-like chemotaxis protein/anti-sigma regulatory factor (Ser/Thr protein kinase)
MKLNKDDRLFKSLSNIFSAGKRAEKLTGQLLAFSRRQMYEPRIIEINPVIQHLEKMVERIIGEDIKIEKNLSGNLPAIKADPAQIEQIIMNLIVNASDAIRDNRNPNSKTITLETALQKAEEETDKPDYVTITVKDTGIGFPEEIKDKVFEPFFTTKEQGRGTGLGLSTVYGIVKQNKANIEINSVYGNGSEIKICWPVCSETPEEQEQLEELENNIAADKESNILIVEDDDAVREFTQYALTHIGYRIYTASNGSEALSFIKNKKIEIDLLFTDMIMPGIDGRELMQQILKIRPNIKALISSGYADDFIVKDGKIDETINFIKKPFSIKALVKKINEILK